MVMKEFCAGGTRGRLCMPDKGADKYPTVIMCHGFNGSFSGNVKYAERLARAGYLCVLFDFTGGSMKSESGGNMLDMTVSGETEELKRVIGYVKGLAHVNGDRLYLMGKSQGGLVAALASVDLKEDIRSLVLLYPAFTIPLMARMTEREYKGFPERYEILGGVVGRPYFYDALEIDIEKCFTYDRKVLILHGDRDDIVPLSSSKKACGRYPNAELKIFHGARHGFKDGYVDRACELMAELFAADSI